MVDIFIIDLWIVLSMLAVLIWLSQDLDTGGRSVNLTEEEDKKELRRLFLENKITKRIAELNEGWVPDWSTAKYDYVNEAKYKYVIEIEEDDLYVNAHFRSKTTANKFYLKTRGLADQLVKELKPELIEYLYY